MTETTNKPRSAEYVVRFTVDGRFDGAVGGFSSAQSADFFAWASGRGGRPWREYEVLTRADYTARRALALAEGRA